MSSQAPAATDVQVGTLLTDPQGDLYVVTHVEHNAYLTAELDAVTTDKDDWDDRHIDEYRPECYPQTLAGTAAPEILAAITERAIRQGEIAEVWADVPPADYRRLYNTLDSVRFYTSKLEEAQAKVADYSKSRAKEMRKVVEIVGTQERAAKILRMNQSTLSRALRDRD